MASKAKRHRKHLERNGRVNPEQHRGERPDFSTHTRKTPSKQTRIRRALKKYNKIEL